MWEIKILIWMSNTHPFHIIIVEEATTLVIPPFIQLWEILNPSARWIFTHFCRRIVTTSHDEHFRQLNYTSLPEIETSY